MSCICRACGKEIPENEKCFSLDMREYPVLVGDGNMLGDCYLCDEHAVELREALRIGKRDE